MRSFVRNIDISKQSKLSYDNLLQILAFALVASASASVLTEDLPGLKEPEIDPVLQTHANGAVTPIESKFHQVI